MPYLDVLRAIAILSVIIFHVIENTLNSYFLSGKSATVSYRKAETVIEETTNTSLSHEKIRNIIVKIGDKITNKEKEERNLFDKKQLIAGLKEVTALFEEADGLWINLQGKDRK